MASSTSGSAGHARKRQYQPSIASYFHQHDSDHKPTSRRPRPTSPLSPPLPEDTQASLLSVGMRVRKSVPEGYKTHKTLNAQGFPFPSTTPALSKTKSNTGSTAEQSRELMPFCGLHKTGGWGMQDVPPSSAPAVMQSGGNMEDEEDEEDGAMPGLSSSQGTALSTQGSFMSAMSTSSSTTSRKRTYEEEIEDDLDAYFDDMDAPGVSASDRPKAPMRSTVGVKGGATSSRVRFVTDSDFEEAAFLTPMDVDGGILGE